MSERNTIHALHDALVSGETTARALTEAMLEGIDPEINAYITLSAEAAR